jgi:hypothetical protein
MGGVGGEGPSAPGPRGLMDMVVSLYTHLLELKSILKQDV